MQKNMLIFVKIKKFKSIRGCNHFLKIEVNSIGVQFIGRGTQKSNKPEKNFFQAY